MWCGLGSAPEPKFKEENAMYTRRTRVKGGREGVGPPWDGAGRFLVAGQRKEGLGEGTNGGGMA